MRALLILSMILSSASAFAKSTHSEIGVGVGQPRKEAPVAKSTPKKPLIDSADCGARTNDNETMLSKRPQTTAHFKPNPKQRTAEAGTSKGNVDKNTGT